MRADECRSLRGELASVALDRSEDDGRTRTLAHLDGCADCRHELSELRRTVRALPAASLEHLDTDHMPSTDLADRITRSAREERHHTRHRRGRRAARVLAGVAAAAIVALVSFALVRIDDTSAALQPFATAPNGAIATFGLEKNNQGTKILLRQRGLDPARVYWLWLTDASGQRFSAGTFRGTAHDETITLQSALPLDQTVRVWCTDSDTAVVLDSWIQR